MPALSSYAPNTSRPTFASTAAPAHCAQGSRHVESAVGEAIGPERPERLLEGEPFGVGRGIMTADRLIVGPGDDRASPHDGGADRHLPLRCCSPGLVQCRRHAGAIGRVERRRRPRRTLRAPLCALRHAPVRESRRPVSART